MNGNTGFCSLPARPNVSQFVRSSTALATSMTPYFILRESSEGRSSCLKFFKGIKGLKYRPVPAL